MKRRELGAVAAFSVLSQLPFLGRAFHVDEPQLLAIARRILDAPLDPLGFSYNWNGCAVEAGRLFTHSTLIPYYLAAGSALGGGSEFWLRLWALPFDALAACALYGLMGRFLSRPLWPTLIVLASPGWFMGASPLLAEKWVLAFGLSSLWVLEKNLLVSLSLMTLAIVVKFNAAFLLLPGAFLLHKKHGPREKPLSWAGGAAAAAAALVFLWEPGRLAAAWTWNLESRFEPAEFQVTIHRWRALPSFLGGLSLCALAWTVWPMGTTRKRFAWTWICAASAALLLFLPAWDLAASEVRFIDRIMGAFLTTIGLTALARFLEPRSRRFSDWPCAALWLFGAAGTAWANQLVSVRSMLFLIPPLAWIGAARLENSGGPRKNWLIGAFAVNLGMSLALAAVDASFAGAQKRVAAMVQARLVDAGQTVWFTGHWGFQHYMEKAGARALDLCAGGWKQVEAGQAVVLPTVNAEIIAPAAPVLASSAALPANFWLPLRLMRFSRASAGLHAHHRGFLPYAFSSEPLDEFRVVLRAEEPKPPRPRKGSRRSRNRP